MTFARPAKAVFYEYKETEMPTITIASNKGGVGKTTTAIILATEFAHLGYQVHLLDCDSNGSASEYWEQSEIANKVPENVTLHTGINKRNMAATVSRLDQDGAIVIIDLPGESSELIPHGIAQADLVLTPVKPRVIEAKVGLRMLNTVEASETAHGRSIAHYFVLTETKNIPWFEELKVRRDFKAMSIPLIKTYLRERPAYSWLHAFGGSLRDLPSKNSRQKGSQKRAVSEAERFAGSVLDALEDALQD